MATATLLMQPRFLVEDANGNPVSGALVHSYIPATTTPKLTWQDAAETIPNSNPVVCDAAGSALIYGSGAYQLTVTDALGVAVPGYSGVSTDTQSLVDASVLTETTRALAAEAAILADFPASLTTNGRQTLSSGLIQQWGISTTSAGGSATITYPIVFPHANFSVVATIVNLGAIPSAILALVNVSSVNFGIASSDSASHALVGPVTFYWQAVGW
jgi:hypothetical protein